MRYFKPELEHMSVVEMKSYSKLLLTLRTIRESKPVTGVAGLMHFSHNPTCQPAQFLANFGERDPGALLKTLVQNRYKH